MARSKDFGWDYDGSRSAIPGVHTDTIPFHHEKLKPKLIIPTSNTEEACLVAQQSARESNFF